MQFSQVTRLMRSLCASKRCLKRFSIHLSPQKTRSKGELRLALISSDVVMTSLERFRTANLQRQTSLLKHFELRQSSLFQRTVVGKNCLRWHRWTFATSLLCSSQQIIDQGQEKVQRWLCAKHWQQFKARGTKYTSRFQGCLKWETCPLELLYSVIAQVAIANWI